MLKSSPCWACDQTFDYILSAKPWDFIVPVIHQAPVLFAVSQFNNCPDWDLLWARHNLLLISNCCRFVYNGRGILVFLFTQAYRMLIGLHTAKDVNDEKSGYQYIASRANSIFEGVNWNSEFESEDSAYFRAKWSADRFSSDLSADKSPTLTIAYIGEPC